VRVQCTSLSAYAQSQCIDNRLTKLSVLYTHCAASVHENLNLGNFMLMLRLCIKHMNRLIICIFPIGMFWTYACWNYRQVFAVFLQLRIFFMFIAKGKVPTFFFSSLLAFKFFCSVSFRFIVLAFVSLQISPGSLWCETKPNTHNFFLFKAKNFSLLFRFVSLRFKSEHRSRGQTWRKKTFPVHLYVYAISARNEEL
jgi:hypothetical protein